MRQLVQKNIHRLVYKPEVLSTAEEADIRRSIETLKGLCLPGLGISEEDRVMIVKAMGFEKGHWFKCQNGGCSWLFMT